MIDARELRIGNHVLDVHERVAIISTISDASVRLSSRNYHYDSFNCSEIRPIPLTEEILMRCGAENLINSATGRTSFDIGSLMFENEEGGFCVFGSEWTIGKPFYYLHQLQNLYFALTGEELNIQL